jgi:hypothetical protein
MKKLVVILGMILLLAVGVTAQEKNVGFGIKAGMDIADNYGDDADGLDTKVGFIGGGFIEYMAAPQFAIQLEALYAMKGAKVSGVDAKFKTDYIEFPLLFKFMIPTQGNIKPNLYAGPALGILTSAKISVDMTNLVLSNQASVDVKDIYKSTDFGIAFGGGIGAAMESFTLTFDVRYTLGMTKIIDPDGFNEFNGYQPSDPDYLTESPDLKNSNFSFMVGVAFK